MAVAQINDGSNTTGLTTVDSNGFTSDGSILGSASYASLSAVSVGSSIGGADAGCGIWAKVAGLTASATNHFWYWMMDSSTAFAAGNGYVAKLTIGAAHERDYLTIYKRVSGVDTALTPSAGAFSDTTNKRIYFKRGKITTSDSIGIVQGDNEHMVFMHDADQGNFLPMGKVVDSTKTTAGYCGLGLGTDSSGKFDDVWSGSVPVKWVSPGTGNNGNSGNKANPWANLYYAYHNMSDGGILFQRATTFSESFRDAISVSSVTYNFSKGASGNEYNYSIIAGHNSGAGVNGFTGGSPTLNFGGGVSRNLANARIVLMYHKYRGHDAHSQPGVTFTSGSSKIRLFEVDAYEHSNESLGDAGAAPCFQDSYNGDDDPGRLSDYDIWVTSCQAHDNTQTHGFYFVRSGVRTEWCDAYENGENGIQYQPLPSLGQSHGQNNVIRSCRAWRCGIETPGTGESGIYIAYQIGLKCFNNIVHHCDHWGIRLNGSTNRGNANTGVKVYHNIAYKCAWSGIEGTNDPFPDAGNDPATDNEIRNNISVGNGTISGGTNTIRLDAGAWDSSNIVSNNVFADPGWPDPDNADLSLCDFTIDELATTVIDDGSAAVSSVATVDFDGVPRPSLNGYDVGPYEHAVSADPPADPVIAAPDTIAVTININKVLSTITIEDHNDPDAGNYTVRLVVKTGTLNDGV